MSEVETVQGPVQASDLGTVLIHEHVRFRDEAVAENWPGRYDADAELADALEAVGAAQSRGVRTIVDPTAMFGGRDVRFMQRVAEETGVRRHRRPRLHRRPPKCRRVDRPGSVWAGPLPAARASKCDDCRAAASGHAGRIFLSQDFCATIDWFPQEARQGLTTARLVDDARV